MDGLLKWDNCLLRCINCKLRALSLGQPVCFGISRYQFFWALSPVTAQGQSSSWAHHLVYLQSTSTWIRVFIPGPGDVSPPPLHPDPDHPHQMGLWTEGKVPHSGQLWIQCETMKSEIRNQLHLLCSLCFDLSLTAKSQVPPINYIFGNIHQIAKDDLGTMLDWLERWYIHFLFFCLACFASALKCLTEFLWFFNFHFLQVWPTSWG